MNLKTRITEKLRNGSVNVPGKNAVHVLAGSLGVNVNGVRQVLQILDSEGLLDTGSGNATATTYLALRDRPVFRPETAEGKRQGRYAVSENGRYYPGEIRPGHPCYRPPVARQMTDEEWRQHFGDLPRPNQTPQQEADIMSTDPTPAPPEPAAAEATSSPSQATAAVPKPRARVKTRKGSPRSNTKQSQQRRANIERVREFLLAYAAQKEGEIIYSLDFTVKVHDELGISTHMTRDYMGELAKENFMVFKKLGWQGTTVIELLPQPVIPTDTRGKCDVTLEVLREYLQTNKVGYTEEVARRTGCAFRTAANHLLRPLYAIGAYRLERCGQHMRVAFVQSDPLSDEQFEAFKAARKAQYTRTPRATEPEPEPVLEQAAARQPESTPSQVNAPSPAATLTPDTADLLRSLVTKAKADKAIIADLQERVSRLEVQNASYAEQLELKTLLLEVEQCRPMTPPPTVVPEDLLAEARALLES